MIPLTSRIKYRKLREALQLHGWLADERVSPNSRVLIKTSGASFPIAVRGDDELIRLEIVEALREQFDLLRTDGITDEFFWKYYE